MGTGLHLESLRDGQRLGIRAHVLKKQQVFYTSEKLFGIHDPAKMPDRALYIANRGLPINPKEGQGEFSTDLKNIKTSCPVYVSVGTLMNSNEPLMEAIIKHLLLSDLPTLVTFGGNKRMFTALSSKLGSRLAGSNVRLAIFVDQTAELQTTDLYFCHSGASSIYESIWYGIPMILIPQDFDQVPNSAALQRENIGKVLAIQDTVEGNM
jgi:UDP:flavonoid glycosyltransferase YjiC (YdhE family)